MGTSKNVSGANAMQTMQIRLTRNQARCIDKLVRRGIYPSRSEAIRNITAKELERRKMIGGQKNEHRQKNL